MRSSVFKWPEPRRGADNPQARFSQEQVEMLRDRYEMGGCTIRQLAEETGAGRSTIGRILKGERYQD